MAILSKPSAAFSATLMYITTGTIIDIWCIVWLLFYAPETREGSFWLAGFFGTGAALLIIGLLLGRIGRAARKAELPPPEVLKSVERAEQKNASTQTDSNRLLPPSSTQPVQSAQPVQRQ